MKCNLRKLLFDRNMTQMALHRATGIRYETIGSYYHGYVKRMSVDDLHKICDSLQCKLSELIEYDPLEPPLDNIREN